MEDNLFNLLNTFKTKTEAYNYFNITPNNYGIKKLKEIAESVNFDLNTYKEKRKKDKRYCLDCGTELNGHQKKFCSHSCSAKVTNKNRDFSEKTKEKIRLKLTKEKNKKCLICGEEKCKNLEVCKHNKKWFNNLVCFGFDLKKIGTLNVYKEYYRIKELILKEYLDNNLSPYDISKKYNYNKKHENILHIIKTFGIKTRNLSESVSNLHFQGKANNFISSITDYQFKHGWHNTWDNKKVYYRSSYELEYFKILDEKKVIYEVEYFRIKYWDKLKNKYRVAIPDLYVKKTNEIIEIKSKVTFNKQNMIDKFDEYKKMGYNVKLIYNNNEYTYDEMLYLDEYVFILNN